MIIDEPTSGLDFKNMRLVAESIKREAGKGRAFLIITHDHELIGSLRTRIIRLGDSILSGDVYLPAQTGIDISNVII